MKISGSVLLALLLLAGAVRAEGVWSVKGHAFSNVHAWQKGTEVRVSGRVSGGPPRSPFQAVVHVRSDEGVTHRVNIRMQTFTGQGETFEAVFRAGKRASWWDVTQIDVVGADPALVERRERQPQVQTFSASTQPAPEFTESSAKCFPIRRDPGNEAASVLFSCLNPVCITIRDAGSGKLVLMKNVSPHDLQETRLRPGRYSAEIAGDGPVRRKEFEITAADAVVDLN